MKILKVFALMIPFLGMAGTVRADDRDAALVVTASNAEQNQLLVYTPNGMLVQTIPTQGKGGASGNAGGVQAHDDLIAAINFGSQNVSIFDRHRNGIHFKQLVPSASNPLSVAFGAHHLYILGATTVESHQLYGPYVSSSADGVVNLLNADGSAAQVGVLPKQLIITEKSNVIETVDLQGDGAVSGTPILVQNIPSNVDTPFGLITRRNNAYVTIAHADEISLVRDGRVLTVTGSGSQHSPCWAALAGPFLYTSNSPSKSISRFAVYGQKIVQDEAVAAMVNGSPTDISFAGGLLAVIDGANQVSHLSIFSVDEDGNLTLKNAATYNGAINGVAVVRGRD